MTTTTRPTEQGQHLDDIAVPRPPLASRARTWLVWLAIIALLVWSWGPTEMHKLSLLVTDWRNMAGSALASCARISVTGMPTSGRWWRRRRSRPGAPRLRSFSASPLPSWPQPISHPVDRSARSFQYSETAAIVIVVVLTVMLIDLISARIRKVLV